MSAPRARQAEPGRAAALLETVAEALDLTAVRKGYRSAPLADCMPCCCCCSCCCCKSEYE